MRKPSLSSPCVADRYSGPGERRAEFSFQTGGSGQLPGGLLLLKDRGPDLPPLVEVYRVEGCEVRTPKPPTSERAARYTWNAAEREIWRDGAPFMALSMCASVMKPHPDGAYTMPDGSRAYRMSGKPAHSWAEVEAAARACVDLLNAADPATSNPEA